jgi:hypothetical protein
MQMGSETGRHNEKSRCNCIGFFEFLVPKRGLEPPRLAALVPETSASTNSATWASQEAHIVQEEFATSGGDEEKMCGKQKSR